MIKNKTFYLMVIPLGLLLLIGSASAILYDPNVTYATKCPDNSTIISVNPNDNVTYGECADLSIVEGWYGKLVHERGHPVIDVSSFTRQILINPETWPTGAYYQWAEYEEPHGNNFMFVVLSEETKVLYANYTENVTVVALPEIFHYNLEERVVSDILVARGDPLSYNNSLITNQSRIWFFGVQDKLYDVPCLNGQLIVNASLIQPLRPGTYYVLIDNPGKNTITEAVWNEDKDLVESPFRTTPSLEVPGYGPRTVYDKIVPWLHQYSDDQLIILKLEVQEPYVDIVGIETAYYGMTDVLQVDGYTNMVIGTEVYAAIDENNLSLDLLVTPRTYEKVTGDINKPGSMREFRIYPPFDLQNKTFGKHSVMVHGPFNTYATVLVPVGLSQEGATIPPEIIRYINGTIWNPTPTPEIIVQREIVTQQVIQQVTVPVPPSDIQVRSAQEEIIRGYATIAVIVVIGAYGLYRLVKYLWNVVRRARV